MNGVVEAILRSPLHRILSRSWIVIEHRGGDTDDEHTTTLRYADSHQGLVVIVPDPEASIWWRDFIEMGQARVLLAGTWVPMTAHALSGSDDPEAVMSLLHTYANRFPKVVGSLAGDTPNERARRAVVVWLRPAS